MKQLSIITENKPGQLNEIAATLGGNGININSLMGDGVGDRGIVRLITTDPTSAKNLLEKKGFKVEEADIFVIKIPDKPGTLAKITKQLRDWNVNIESIYLMNKLGKVAELALQVDNPKKAAEILGL